jgi:hypothetical protein
MTDEKVCPACEMPFDWPGVTEAGEEYCCAECARGLPCSCPQHDHRTETTAGKAGTTGTARAG